MHRLYVYLCRKWRRDGLTLSAAAHVRALDGYPFWRDRIDGWKLFWRSEHQHCQTAWQMETRP